MPDEVLIKRAQDERTRAETYKWKYLELKGQMGTVTESLEQLRIRSKEELEQEKATSQRRGVRADRLARSLQKEKEKVKDSQTALMKFGINGRMLMINKGRVN